MKTTVFSTSSLLIDGFLYGVRHVLPGIKIVREPIDDGWRLLHDDASRSGPDQHFALDDEGLHPVVEPVEPDPLTTAYIIKGFWDRLRDLNFEMNANNDGPEMDIMSSLISMADLDERLYRERGNDSGLVWVYEISEPFGAAIADHFATGAGLPDKDHAQRMLASIFENTCAQGIALNEGP
jgi:hypothetical protein